MEDSNDKRLRPAEVEMILRRASELNARRWTRDAEDTPSVSPEVLVQVAAAAGIPEQDVRRAMWDVASEKTAEPHSFARRYYGLARLRAVRVVDAGEARCEASLTADLSDQRGEYLSLAGILAATLAVLFILAGMQSPLFFLGVLPALAAPIFGFRYAYGRGCREIRRSLDDLLDAVEVGLPNPEEPEDRPDRPQGPIQGLEPIPRFVPK